jgi:hypothetical protein
MLSTPLTFKLTLEENGPSAAIVTVNEIFDPRLTVALLGDTASEKSATTNVTWVECVRVPLVAVMVRGTARRS